MHVDRDLSSAISIDALSRTQRLKVREPIRCSNSRKISPACVPGSATAVSPGCIMPPPNRAHLFCAGLYRVREGSP